LEYGLTWPEIQMSRLFLFQNGIILFGETHNIYFHVATLWRSLIVHQLLITQICRDYWIFIAWS
jgi:hypothetical protein